MDVRESIKKMWRWWGHADALRGLLEVAWFIWRLLSGLGGLAILVVFIGLLIGWISEYAALIAVGAALLVSMGPFSLWIFDVNGFRTLRREVPQDQVAWPGVARVDVSVPESAAIRHAPTFRQRIAEAWRQVKNFFRPLKTVRPRGEITITEPVYVPEDHPEDHKPGLRGDLSVRKIEKAPYAEKEKPPEQQRKYWVSYHAGKPHQIHTVDSSCDPTVDDNHGFGDNYESLVGQGFSPCPLCIVRITTPTFQFETQNKGQRALDMGGRPQALRFRKPVEKIVRPEDLPVELPCGQGKIVVTAFLEKGFVIEEHNTIGDLVVVERYPVEISSS